MPATMSLLGLYNWDRTILDGLSVPSGVDKSVLVNNLLRECAELEILYPQPDALKFFVTEWSKERLPVWTRLEATQHYEYDPISNYDRKEEWTDAESANGSREGTSGVSGTRSDSGDNGRETFSAGYNSDTFDVPSERISETINTEGRESSEGEFDESISENRSGTRTGRAYGNIGVTTTQQMIQQEREVSKFDMCEVIVSEFKQTFCILVY